MIKARTRRREIKNESGSIESYLVIAPVLLLVVGLIQLFQYGLAVNTLGLDATLVGRQLARTPDARDLNSIAEESISRNQILVDDFHVMRFNVGNQVVIQTILVGKPINFGMVHFTPSGKSLAVVDQWR